ncbi:MAG TPA: toll/interleukin-1 receptor domain-containing protein [Isosphaeraceae bacterium]|jgi:hypothetical protein|nr:toll/interleukin-1 receptor domain-containing protein [Isosphaeraceae bacterium]
MAPAEALAPDPARVATPTVEPARARRVALLCLGAPAAAVILIFLLQLGLTDRLEGESAWVALWIAVNLALPPLVLATPVLASLRLIGPGAGSVGRGRSRLAWGLAAASGVAMALCYLAAQALLVNSPLPIALFRLAPIVLLPQLAALWLLAPAIPRLPARWFPAPRPDVADGPPPTGVGPVSVFLSYAHGDEALVDVVRRQLAVYENNGWVDDWYDRKLVPGDKWEPEIDRRLATAGVIVLFVSPDFLASKYAYWNETQAALRRHEAGEARVVPVILRPCDWRESPLGGLQAVPKDGKPVSTWPDQDEATLDAARGVLNAIRKFAIARAAAGGESGAATA